MLHRSMVRLDDEDRSIWLDFVSEGMVFVELIDVWSWRKMRGYL